jgi:hypothetical protein
MISLLRTDVGLLIGWIVYTVAAFGLAYIVGHSRISRPVRLALWDVGGFWAQTFVTLLECPACFGFWIGLAMGLAAFNCNVLPWPAILAFPFYTTGMNFLLGRATGLITDPSLD